MNPILILLIVFSHEVWSISSEATSVERRLRGKLLQDYDMNIRPVRNASHPVTLDVKLTLIRLVNLDMVKRTWTTNVWLTLKWKDEFLKWNTADYPVHTIMLKEKEIWSPDLVIYNLHKKTKLTENSHALVNSDGTVILSTFLLLETSCGIDVQQYPSDRQTCLISMGSWTMSSDKLAINKSVSLSLNDYVSSPEWKIFSTRSIMSSLMYSCCTEPYQRVKFYIGIKRCHFAAFFNLVVPCIVLQLIAIIGSFLPSFSGKRINLCIINLLVLSVFLLMVPEFAPSTCNGIPRISVFFMNSLLLMSFNIAATVVVLRLHHQSSSGVKPRAVYRCVLYRSLMSKLDSTLTRKWETLSKNHRDRSMVLEAEKAEHDSMAEAMADTEDEIWATEWTLIAKFWDWVSFLITFIGCILNIALVGLGLG